jgi:hypothetical protein
VSSEQALADIRGVAIDNTLPTEFSKDYKPVYLFYGNLDLLLSKDQQVITLEDYTFDDEYEYEPLDQEYIQDPPEEDETCMHCGIKEIVNDVNDMFFCEYCNRGVHQLCEEPPIHASEKDIDPWYCRTCCKAQNIPIPSSSIPEEEGTPSVSIKRKRDDGLLIHDNNKKMGL